MTGKLSLRRSTIAPWRSEQIQSASAKRKRLGVRKRLIAHGLSEAAVDRWMEAWEASGPLEAPGGSFWGRGADWILSETAAARKPPIQADVRRGEQGARR